MVCTTLLSQQSLRPCLRALPRRWLQFLLRRLAGAEQQFILRRSSGFAMAFQSVFRAEPGSCQGLLLRHTVPQLLRLAEAASSGVDGGRDASPETTSAAVHALNVLKLLFQDRQLADELTPFLVSAFTVAVSGFRWVGSGLFRELLRFGWFFLMQLFVFLVWGWSFLLLLFSFPGCCVVVSPAFASPHASR